MNRKSLCLALLCSLTAAGPAAAGGIVIDDCGLQSHYSLRLDAQSLRLQRDGGSPQEVRMQGGRLWVDGSEAALAAADRERVARIEQQVRALLPEVRALALEGVAMAGEALTQVAVTFGGADGDAIGERLHALQTRVAERFDGNLRDGNWDAYPIEDEVTAAVESLVPELVASLTAVAVRAALSGDSAAAEDLERRAERLERDLEQAMQQRGKQLEARAEALCPRLREIDALEDALEWRLQDGRRLDLVSN